MSQEHRTQVENKLEEIRIFLSSLHGEVNSLERSYSEVLLVLQNLESRLETTADRDDLTGLFRRKAFFRKWEALLERCADAGRACSVLMIDIDHFKKINDSHGHAAGDEVIRRVARLLETFANESCIAGRLGGEEFVIALAAPEDRAVELAESIRRETEATAEPVPCTVSIGVASSPRSCRSLSKSLIEAADQGLYEAKNSGRNRVRKATLSLIKNTG